MFSGCVWVHLSCDRDRHAVIYVSRMSTRGERARRRQQRQQWVERQARGRSLHRSFLLREQTGARVVSPAWGGVFVQLLHRALGAEPFWDDLMIVDDTGGEDALVFIQSHQQHRVHGRLIIGILHGPPRFGFSTDPHPDYANEWSRRIRDWRACRMRLKPHQLFSPLVRVLEDRSACGRSVQRFVGYDTWNHGAFVSMRPFPNLSVYHDDYSISYPVLAITEMAIRVYYRSL